MCVCARVISRAAKRRNEPRDFRFINQRSRIRLSPERRPVCDVCARIEEREARGVVAYVLGAEVDGV